MATMYDYAVRYINMGLAIFPLKPADKIPLTKNGCKDATTDGAQVKAWWQQYPNANIGIATGSKSNGLIVIDLDIDEDKGKDGKDELRTWELENGDLPETWTSTTGRGGSHLFFRSEKTIRNRAGILEGVDIRGEGGYIVAPPSLHHNGRRYSWDLAPADVALAEANETVYKFLEYKETAENSTFKSPETIGEGKRNDTIFKMASSLQEKGYDDEAILALLKVENDKKCVPPLSDKELEQILGSVTRYRKGENKDIPVQKHLSIWECKSLLTVNEKGKILQSIDNVCIVLRNDKDIVGRLKYNEFAFAPWVKGALPWDLNVDNDREWTNIDDSNIKCYLEKHYGLSNADKIMEALNIVMNENKFNPVCDTLNALKWDGKKRIDDLLPKYLGVTKNEYSKACMRTFMLGAISRAFNAGCKFDYMPVLVGGQGVGKSTFTKMLAIKEEWNEDNFNTVESDKAVEKLRAKWIIELAELLAVKRAKEVESMKAFLTSTHDTYRAPYARRSESRARQCVFIGTTNNMRFLTDRTGNRRYLPLMVDKNKVQKPIYEDLAETKAEIMQAWAEAMEIYRSGEFTLVLPKNLQDEVESMQSAFVEEDPRVGYIQHFLDNTKEDFVCVAMLHELALDNEFTKPSRRESNELHEIMETCVTGWRRVQNNNNGRRRCGKYGLQICYERVPTSEELSQYEFNPVGNLKLPFE